MKKKSRTTALISSVRKTLKKERLLLYNYQDERGVRRYKIFNRSSEVLSLIEKKKGKIEGQYKDMLYVNDILKEDFNDSAALSKAQQSFSSLKNMTNNPEDHLALVLNKYKNENSEDHQDAGPENA